MQRQSLIKFAAIASALCAASAFAQQGDLAGVTMRVLDDVSDVRAVILDLDANRGDGEEAADETEPAERNAADATSAEGEGSAERREREALHDPDHDERSEGKLEDNDVEVPAVPPAP